MRIETIILFNRAPFEQLQLELGEENVFILSGINGAGKTTILSYITDAFYELAKKAFHNEFENKTNKYYRISSGLYSLDNSKVSIVYIRFGNKDGRKNDYLDIRGKCTKEMYDQIIKLKDKIQFDEIKQTLNDVGNVKYWSSLEKKTIQMLFDENILTYFPAYRYETPSYINDPYKMEIPYTTAMRISGYMTNPIEVMSDLSNIANWIMDVVLDQTVYPAQNIELLNQINTVLSNILITKAKCKTRVGIGPRSSGAERIAVLNRDNGEHFYYPSIFSMSSGELALLCIFGELVKQADRVSKSISDVEGIVLVDEIEKHLHIRLQKEIVPQLIRLFPNLQFVITSHSPFLALGIQEESNITCSLIDLDKNGIKSLPNQTEIYKEVYELMISQNEQFAEKYNELKLYLKQSKKLLVITEGKTDWKHIKAAMRRLKITDIDIVFFEYEDILGDTTLRDLLNRFAEMPLSQPIIGVFDRDNLTLLDELKISDCAYRCISNSVYAFAIPLVNCEEYGSMISIEHYFKRTDLCKTDENGRRIFLGDEFYCSGISKNGEYETKTSKIQHKVEINGVIDEKVYKRSDLEQKHSFAMSKTDFVNKIINEDSFAEKFDFSSFNKIFSVLRDIVKEISSNTSDN